MAVNKSDGPQTRAFPVVGIGASAGGIEALHSLFSLLPPQTGLAFVVIQHLLPDHPSHLAELLGKTCRLPVCEAQDGMRVEPDHVYIIAPGERLALDQGTLRSRPFLSHTLVCIDLIDTFFKSLATDRGQQAIAVILSGTGSDGADGVIQIKQVGGTVFVQNPTTAMHGGMPCAAIATGTANHILPVAAIARELLAATSAAAPPLTDTGPEDIAQPLDEILTLIRRHTGSDMSSYKFSPLFWQVQQRMQARRLGHVHDYVTLLYDDPAELEALVRNLPIHVTEFFRDPEAWEVLASEVIAPLIRDHRGDRPLRVWTPACSSGEEAYSVAMLLAEQFDQLNKPADFQIFATDASPEIVARASRGVFSAAAIQGLSPERLARFFSANEGKYRIEKNVREKVVFAPQHLLADPPFANVDLVTCRNFLIYLEPYAQKQVLTLLHASLKMGGYLFLGRGETLISNQGGFEVISMPWRIYRKTASLADTQIRFPKRLQRLLSSQASATLGAENAHRAIVEEFDLPSVLIDAQFNILHVYGDTSSFLRLPPGQPTLNLLAMAPSAWAADIQTSAQNALAEQRPMTVDGLREAKKVGGIWSIKLTPIQAGEEESAPRLLVSFVCLPLADDRALPGNDEPALSGESSTPGWRDTLRLTIEELEASREELQVLNEELRAVNDQLNLSNEEINNVNAQLRDKIQELETQSHVLSSGAVRTLFLDKELRVQWFTPAISELFPLRSYDAGRKITELVPRFVDLRFIDDIQAVMRRGKPLEGEVRNVEGRWYLRRIGPFRTGRDKTTGVAITFTDITERKQTEESLQRERSLLVSVMQATDFMLVFLDPQFNFVWVNPAYADSCKMKPEEMVGKNHFALYPHAENEAIFRHVRDTGEAVSYKDKPFVFRDQPERGTTYWNWSLIPVKAPDGTVTGLVFSLLETTKFKQAQEALSNSEYRLRRFYDSGLLGIIYWNMDGKVIDANDKFLEMVGYDREDLTAGRVDWQRMTPPEYAYLDKQATVDLLATGVVSAPFEKEYIRKDGTRLPVILAGAMLDDERFNGVAFVLDITERKQAEEEIQAQRNLFETVLNHLPVAVNIVRASDLKILLINPKYQAFAPKKKMLGKPLLEVWPEVPEIEKFFQHVAKTGKPFSLRDAPYKIRRSENGPLEEAYFSWSLFRIALPGNAGWGLLNTAWETSDRKQTEVALRQALSKAEEGDRMLAAMMEYMPEGIAIADAPDVKIRMISRAGRKMTGKPDRHLKVGYGKLVERWNVYRADGVTKPADNELPLVRSTQQGEVVQDEVWVIAHKDGRHIPVLCNAGPIRDAQGNITGGIIAFRDIAARLQAEDALRESERLLRILFNSIDEGFCIIEMVFDAHDQPIDYRFLEVNAVFERLTGLADAEGKTMRSLKPNHEEHWFKIYGQIALTGEPMHFENPAVELGRFYQVYAFRIGNPDERKVAILFRDITERQPLEKVPS
ncbi:MAG: chemotaxis protein CheB [Methylomicrobium sp.]